MQGCSQLRVSQSWDTDTLVVEPISKAWLKAMLKHKSSIHASQVGPARDALVESQGCAVPFLRTAASHRQSVHGFLRRKIACRIRLKFVAARRSLPLKHKHRPADDGRIILPNAPLNLQAGGGLYECVHNGMKKDVGCGVNSWVRDLVWKLIWELRNRSLAKSYETTLQGIQYGS